MFHVWTVFRDACGGIFLHHSSDGTDDRYSTCMPIGPGLIWALSVAVAHPAALAMPAQAPRQI